MQERTTFRLLAGRKDVLSCVIGRLPVSEKTQGRLRACTAKFIQMHENVIGRLPVSEKTQGRLRACTAKFIQMHENVIRRLPVSEKTQERLRAQAAIGFSVNREK